MFGEYAIRKLSCRMQNPEFRERYLDPIIAAGAKLPYDVNEDKARIFRHKSVVEVRLSVTTLFK